MTTPIGRHRRQSRVPLRWKLPVIALVIVGLTIFLAIRTSNLTAVITVMVLVSMFNAWTSSLEVKWRLYGRRDPEARSRMRLPEPPPNWTPRLTLDILAPAYHEASVFGQTLRSWITGMGFDNFKIFATLRSDDPKTIAVARSAATEHPRHIEVIAHNYGRQKGKPLQLNTALLVGTGDIVVVYDAEDDVRPDTNRRALRYFEEHPEIDILQVGVQLVNLGLTPPHGTSLLGRLGYALRSWYCIHNVLEYYFWFSGRMFYQIEQGVVPLGGNTIFMRRKALEKLGGWEDLLTEDCDLGVRATALEGMQVAALYEPRFTTREETPERLIVRRIKGAMRKPDGTKPKASTLVTQRTRWSQGFLQVLFKDDWQQLKTIKQRLMAVYILGMPFIQAFNAAMLPVSLTAAFFLVAPVGFVLVMFLPLIPVMMTFVIQWVGYREFTYDFGQQRHLRHYVYLALGFYPYMLILGWAGLLSIVRHMTGRNDWVKTSHAGHHLAQGSTGAPASATAILREEGGAA